MPIISLVSYKGGSGKSTVSMNLAEALRRSNLDVILVDIDASTKTATAWSENSAMRHNGFSTLPPTTYISGDVLTQLKKIASTYQVVVVDCGAGNSRENQLAVSCSDLLLLPLAPSGFEILPTLQFATEIAAAQIKNNGLPKANLVLNKIAPAKGSSRELVDMTLSAAFPIKPLKTLVPARAAMEKLILDGQTVFDAPRAGDLKDVFAAMAAEVRGILNI